MNPPLQGSWYSQWSQANISAEELVREIALNAVSKVLMLRLFTDEAPDVGIYPQGVGVKLDSFRYFGGIPVPSELSDYLRSEWSVWYPLFLSNYIPGPSDGLFPRSAPSGEKVGELFRMFKVLDQLIVIAKRMGGWPDNKIVGIHGASDDLINKLRAAGILYMLVWAEEGILEVDDNGLEIPPDMAVNYVGSGCMLSISLTDAESLAIEANSQSSVTAKRLFNLQYPFKIDSWSSNHPRFSS